MPKISIITPTYNSETTISGTIEALLRQSFTDFEYIVVDGLSKDKTVDKVKSYIPEFDKKGIELKIVSEKDKGVYDAMNKGVVLAKGRLIGITNSDDWYEDWTLETVWSNFTDLSVVKQQPNTILYGIERIWKEDKVYNLQRRGADFVPEGVLPHSTFFVAKEVYEKIGDFDLSISILADYDFTSRCYKAGVDIIGIDKVLSNFKLGGLSSSFFNFYSDYHAIQYKYGFITKKRYKELIFVLKLKKTISKLVNRW